MRFKEFCEEMEPAHCYHNGTELFFAKTKDVVVKYDAPVNEFLIYHNSDLILDGADLRTAKAFIKLMTKMEKQ